MSAALEIVKNNPFIIIIIIIIKNLKIWKSSIESPRNILVSSVVSPVLFSKNHADSLISDHCTRWRTIFAFSIANSYARKRHECTSDYWDLAFPQMKFHKTARGPWPLATRCEAQRWCIFPSSTIFRFNHWIFFFLFWGATRCLRMSALRPASQAGQMHNPREGTSVA